MGYWRTVKLFNRDVRLVLVTAGLMGFTIFGGIYSLLMNLYLLRLGYGPEFIGLLHGLGTLSWAAGCLLAGSIGRRIGSRRSMIIGMGMATFGYTLLPFAGWLPAGWHAAWLISTYAWGNLIIALYDVNMGPFLMEVTGPAERDHVFSVQAALWPLAGFIGSLIGGFLPGLFASVLDISAGQPSAYAYPLILAAATLFLAAFALSRTRTDQERGKVATAAGVEALDVGGIALPLGLIGFLGLVVLLAGTGEGAARSFFNVYMDDGLGISTVRIGTLTALAQFLGITGALGMPLITQRWGHRRTFIWGSVGMAASLLPLALLPRLAAAGIGYIAMMTLASLVRPALSVYLMDAVPQGWRPTMSAVTNMGLGLSWAGISAGGGFIITALGYPAFFLLSAAVTVVGVFVFSARPTAKAA